MNLTNILRIRVTALLVLILSFNLAESKPIIFGNGLSRVTVGKQIEILSAPTGLYTIENIAGKQFDKADQDAPVFFIHDKTLWGRFSATNASDNPTIYFALPYPNITEIKFYKMLDNGQSRLLYSTGNVGDFATRSDTHVDYNFNLYLTPGETGTYYFKINSVHPVELSAALITLPQLVEDHFLQSTIMAAYLGVILSILLYNLFLYFATRDKSYIIYVVYLFALAMAQLTLAGWSFKYLWPHHGWINNYAVIWTSGITGIAAIAFAISFLHVSSFLPKVEKVLYAFMVMYVVALLLSFTPYTHICYLLLNFNGLIAGLMLIYVSARISGKGYRPALYYLLAWSAFLVGVIVFVLRNIGLIPLNSFTTYILFIGSAIEAILLSIALADKIAILRKEKEISQAEALRISKENEQLVKEQNIVLERKVIERTEELQAANNQVTMAFKDLKDAQIQLVEAEKMASLGQLTAGIAHEINNPINFVKSNIKPLQLDFKDLMEVIDEYEKLHAIDAGSIGSHLKEIEALKKSMDLDFVKTEIQSLMKGIENGAERTAEIVRGLRTFSRLDESVIKTVDIHEGIDSTLILLRSNIPSNITVIKEYNATAEVECFPGKLNQVFMNILSNAVQAIKGKEKMAADERVTIKTSTFANGQIEIRISDTGSGMSEQVKKKIFDPFFTTKEVGEGTGLGLAIVFKIIQEHGGKIEVTSIEGEGTEFIITLHNAIPGKPII